MIEFAAECDLAFGERQPGGNLFFGFGASSLETAFKFFFVWREHEYRHAVRICRFYLPGTFDVYFKKDVFPCCKRFDHGRFGRAVKIAYRLRPLEELAPGKFGGELFAAHEKIMHAVHFSVSRLSRRCGYGDFQVGHRFEQPRIHRSLPHSGRTG